ncbi:MAG: DUF1849 family protein [Proteobacteria bacterium]|nr:DUF1849 family protein [Pseudomonadota bacterium]
MSFVLRSILAAFAFIVFTAAARGPVPVQLLSHRATYEVSLDRTSPGAVVSVRGRTVTEFRDVCTGWSTTQRFVADMVDTDADITRSDFSIQLWESKDGRAMTFDATNVINNKVDEREKGKATLSAAGGEVVIAAGKRKRFVLPAETLFPTPQAVDMIKAAQAGASTARRTVFQGGSEDQLYLALATIGHPASPAQTADERRADTQGLLKNVPAYPVLVSFFPQSGDMDTPDYEVASHLYANGVIGTMSLIYPKFTMKARLVKLEKLPSCR